MKKYTKQINETKTLSTKNVYNGFLKMDMDTIQTKKGETIHREVMRRGKSVCALIFDTVEKKYIFAKQYRVGSKSDLVEVVAGMLESGEDPSNCIKREILEEVGYESDKCENIGGGFVSPGGTSEYMHFFYVEVSNKTAKGGGLETEHEDIEVIKMTSQEAKSYNFQDLKTMYCICKVIK